MHGLRNVMNRVVASFSNCSLRGETKVFSSQAGPRPESFEGLDSDINIQRYVLTSDNPIDMCAFRGIVVDRINSRL